MRSEGPPQLPLRVKIEINSPERLTVLGFEERRFAVESIVREFTDALPVA